jgi:pimeloyl-ACP methyl ester carboxylesterase
MTVERRIRDAEEVLFTRYGLESDESFIEMRSTQIRLRVLSVGSGPDLVMLHGVSLSAAIWAPLLNELKGYRTHLVELPGHGLSEPFTYPIGSVRGHSIQLLDDLFDSLELARPSVVGHSLGGMIALWHAAERPGRITSLVAIGDPGAALPGVQVRVPLSVLTVRGLGRAVLSSPLPRSTYRQILGQGTSPAAVRSMPDELVDILRLACRRKGNPKTVASLMHAIDGFRRPRPETLMSDNELADPNAHAVLLGARRSVPRTAPGAALNSKDPRCRIARGGWRTRSLVREFSRLRQIDRRAPDGADVSGEKGRLHGTTGDKIMKLRILCSGFLKSADYDR